MSLDLMPKSIRKYQGQISWAEKERQRSAINILNNKTIKLSHVLQETAVLDEFSVNAMSRVNKIQKLMAGCRDLPLERAWDEIQNLNLYLNNSNSYYPFRVTIGVITKNVKFHPILHLFEMNIDIKLQILRACINIVDTG